MASDVGMTTGVCTLWQQEELVDYIIEVEDEQFKVHRVIMASVSDYFKAMLTGGMVESQTDKVRLEGLRPLVVSNMIEYIYTGQFGTKTARTEDLLGCAVYFQFPAAIEKCSDLLFGEITEENCFEALIIFKTYSLKFYVGLTQKYIKSNIDNILENFKPNDLPYDAFLILMDLWGKSEWELFDSANLWISVDFENRVKHLNELMSHIRYSLMTPAQLEAVQNSYIFSAFKDPWCDLVHKAIEFHSLPTHLKVLDDYEQNIVRDDPLPVCFSTDSVGEYYLGKSWKKYISLQAPAIGQPAAILEVNNYLIVCDDFQRGASCVDQNWYLFDPYSRKWCTMACMMKPRDAFALVHHGRYLYALGGLVRETPAGIVWSYSVDDSIERFDFDSNTWSKRGSKLPISLQKHGACAISDSIYVTGGWNSVGEEPYDSVWLHCFTPSTNTWEHKPSMPDMVSDCKIFVLNLWNEDVLFVIGKTLRMQYYSPCTNQWSKWQWKCYVNTEISWDEECTILAKGSTFYFLNFRSKAEDSSDEESDSEWWDPSDEETIKVCEKWSVEEKGKKITRSYLDEFPLTSNNLRNHGRNFFCALLSFVPPTAANRD